MLLASVARRPSRLAPARLLMALLVLLAGGYGYARLGGLFGARLADGPQPVTLVRISDGDTLHLRPQRGGEALKVRLIGIDSPELGSADGFRAAAALSLLVVGAGRLELEPELTARGKVEHDKYGRVLGWVWVTPGLQWPRQRDWLLRYPAAHAPRQDAGRKLRPGAPARILLQEELAALGCAEPYRAAAGSRYYSRIESAAR